MVSVPRMTIAPPVFDGTRVRMEPLDLSRHRDGPLAIGLDEDLWRWTVSFAGTGLVLGYLALRAMAHADPVVPKERAVSERSRSGA